MYRQPHLDAARRYGTGRRQVVPSHESERGGDDKARLMTRYEVIVYL